MKQHIDVRRLLADRIPSRRYVTHAFDSYPAKMLPHMARFLVEKISRPGQLILDPFCGSGTVLVESVMAGRSALGIDLNPLAVLLARAKTTIYDKVTLESQLSRLLALFKQNSVFRSYDFPNASYWFTPATIRKLGVIRAVLDDVRDEFDPPYVQFWEAILATIVRPSSRADTRGPKPFISKTARQRRVGRHFDPFKLFEDKARHFSSLEDDLAVALGRHADCRCDVAEGDCRHLSKLLSGRQVDAIVTSPPYLNAQDYYRSSKLELWVLRKASPTELRRWSRTLVGSDRIRIEEADLCASLDSPTASALRLNLAERNRKNACVFARYVRDMSTAFHEFKSILSDSAYCAVVSGHNLLSDVVIPTYEVMIELASAQGFRLVEHYVDMIRDRWVPPTRNGHRGVIEEEHMLVFRKTGS